MVFREISPFEFIKPKPNENYPLIPKKDEDRYSRNFSRTNIDYFPNTKSFNPKNIYSSITSGINYDDWEYNRKKKKRFEYEGLMPLRGSYGGGDYSIKSSGSKAGSYKTAA